MSDELIAFSRAFKDEDHLTRNIATLFRRREDVCAVEITHGTHERGKDIVFYVRDAVGDLKLHACVVKFTKINGSASSNQSAITVLNQVRQALTNPYLNPSGQKDDVAHVYVMTPFDVAQSTMYSIEGELRERSGQVTFCCGGKLLALFRKYFEDFQLESGDLAVYLSQMRNSFDRDNPVSVLLHQHGVFDASERPRQIYVKQRFQVTLAQFHCSVQVPAVEDFTKRLPPDVLRGLNAQIADLRALMMSPFSSFLGARGSLSGDQPDRTECTSFLAALTVKLDEWSDDAHRLRKPAASKTERKGGAGDHIAIDWTSEDLGSLANNLKICKQFIQSLQKEILVANRFVQGRPRVEATALHSAEYLTYCAVQEIAIAFPTSIRRVGPETTYLLPMSLLDDVEGSILITGAPGYGKTSLCKFSAKTDAEKLSKKPSSALPVYVLLHQLATRQLGSFREEFLASSELQSLASATNPDSKKRVTKIRLYLDGLDEVPNIERQNDLMQLAQSAADTDRRIRVVVTARDYVHGPWLNWLPRVNISGFDETQARELVSGLLKNDASEINRFYGELDKTPSLKPLMQVPLLATLIVAVYGNRTTLPENRGRLYEIFVELLCGGWDSAKNVRRPTKFGSVGKISVLSALAGRLHNAEVRECTYADIENVIRGGSRVFEGRCPELIIEFLQDGILVGSGANYAFCHLSFQEFLAAKDLHDPSGRKQREILRKYLAGQDWWYQTLSFYISLLAKPTEAENWIANNARDLSGLMLSASTLARYDRMLKCIVDSSPGYTPNWKRFSPSGHRR